MEPDTVRAMGEASADLEKAMDTLGIDVIILKIPFGQIISSLEIPNMCRLPSLENSIVPIDNVRYER